MWLNKIRGLLGKISATDNDILDQLDPQLKKEYAAYPITFGNRNAAIVIPQGMLPAQAAALPEEEARSSMGLLILKKEGWKVIWPISRGSLFSKHTERDKADMPTVLIIEDDEEMQFIMTQALKGKYTVLTASDAREGLMKLSETPTIDVMLTDVVMPGIDGIKLIEQIRALEKFQNLPVIVVSGFRTPEREARAREAGAVNWLDKPFELRDIEIAVKLAL